MACAMACAIADDGADDSPLACLDADRVLVTGVLRRRIGALKRPLGGFAA